MVKTKDLPMFDAAEFLATPEHIAGYLSEALATGDAADIAEAIGTAARAKGMTSIAEAAGLSRENLYRALSSSGRPEFDTIMRVLRALDVQLLATPRDHAA
jgi:probable addiction module antidote protein